MLKANYGHMGKTIAVFSVGNVVNHTIEKAQQLDYKALDNYLMI